MNVDRDCVRIRHEFSGRAQAYPVDRRMLSGLRVNGVAGVRLNQLQVSVVYEWPFNLVIEGCTASEVRTRRWRSSPFRRRTWSACRRYEKCQLHGAGTQAGTERYCMYVSVSK